jgi:sulfite exporter TauE/SafE
VLAAVASVPLLLYAFWPRSWSPAFLQRLYALASRRVAALPPLRRALSLGLLTPALPCGLLYAAAGAALSAPSPLMGAGWMLAFAGGTAFLLGQAFVGPRRIIIQDCGASAVLAALTILFCPSRRGAARL